MKFFFDNNMSPYLAKALSVLSEPDGHTVVHLREKFKSNISDEDWMATLHSEGGWVVISNDRFSKNSVEKEALRRTGFIAFVLKSGWQKSTKWDQAAMMIRWWPRIMEQAKLNKNGAFYVPFNFSGNGKFEAIQ